MNIKIFNGLNKNAKFIWIFAILILMLFILPLKTLAIGQVTEPIMIKNAQRGQEPQATLTIINNDKAETEIGLLAKGDISSWTGFYSITNPKNAIQSIKMAAGSQAKIIARFRIPDDARNGKYKGYVSVSKKFGNSAPDKDQSSVSISQEIDREVTIEINDEEIIGFEVSVIPATYDLKKDEPLSIRLIYDNSGNVSIAPQAQIKIKKDSQTVFNAIYPYPEEQPAVKPGEIYEIPAIQILTSNLEVGKYRAEMSFFIDGKVIQEKSFGFSVGIFAGSVSENNEPNRSILASLLNEFNFSSRSGLALVAFLGMLTVYSFLKSKSRDLGTNSANIEENKKIKQDN